MTPRIAGILMIIVGLISLPLTQILVDVFGETMIELFVFIPFVSLALTLGGGVCAIRKKAYWWAMTGAICSVIAAFTYMIIEATNSWFEFPLNYVQPGTLFTLLGILSVIILRTRKGEFQG